MSESSDDWLEAIIEDEFEQIRESQERRRDVAYVIFEASNIIINEFSSRDSSSRRRRVHRNRAYVGDHYNSGNILKVPMTSISPGSDHDSSLSSVNSMTRKRKTPVQRKPQKKSCKKQKATEHDNSRDLQTRRAHWEERELKIMQELDLKRMKAENQLELMKTDNRIMSMDISNNDLQAKVYFQMRKKKVMVRALARSKSCGEQPPQQMKEDSEILSLQQLQQMEEDYKILNMDISEMTDPLTKAYFQLMKNEVMARSKNSESHVPIPVDTQAIKVLLEEIDLNIMQAKPLLEEIRLKTIQDGAELLKQMKNDSDNRILCVDTSNKD